MMTQNRTKRFQSLWKKESDNENALFIDLSVGPEQSDMEAMYHAGREKTPAEKDANLSLFFRTEGNSAYCQRKWHEAMEFYNKSLCFAKTGSENMSFSYANRSGCFFNLKMFKKCLTDIDLAVNANYPKLGDLEARKIKCLLFIEAGDEFVPFVPMLSYEPNEKFPCMANVLKIEKNQKLGRFITATSYISVGETILIEKAFVSNAIQDKQLRCSICYRFETNLVPCSECTTDMFCYSECEYNSFHNIECNMKVSDTHDDHYNFYYLKIVRSILTAIQTIPNVEELMAFVEKAIQSDPLEIPASEPVDQLSKYRTFLQLTVNSKVEANRSFRWDIYFIYRTLLNHPFVEAIFQTVKHQRFLMHLIGHHYNVVHFNAWVSINIVDGKYSTELQPLIAAYFNHSCAPNVATVSSESLVTAIAIRPIKADEQLFISYFGRDLRIQAEDRLIFFEENLDFICECQRCFSIEETYFPIRDSYDICLAASIAGDYYKINFDFSDQDKVKYFLDKCAKYLTETNDKPWTGEVSMVMHFFMYMLAHQTKYKLSI